MCGNVVCAMSDVIKQQKLAFIHGSAHTWRHSFSQARRQQRQDADRATSLQHELDHAREALRGAEGAIQTTEAGHRASPHDVIKLQASTCISSTCISSTEMSTWTETSKMKCTYGGLHLERSHGSRHSIRVMHLVPSLWPISRLYARRSPLAQDQLQAHKAELLEKTNMLVDLGTQLQEVCH